MDVDQFKILFGDAQSSQGEAHYCPASAVGHMIEDKQRAKPEAARLLLD